LLASLLSYKAYTFYVCACVSGSLVLAVRGKPGICLPPINYLGGGGGDEKEKEIHLILVPRIKHIFKSSKKATGNVNL
jgi:hypothetical protein